MKTRFCDIRRCEVRDDKLLADLVVLWEASVRATHDFLSESDIVRIRGQVTDALKNVRSLFAAVDSSGRSVAFSGADGDSLEMLFVHPDYFGCGIGGLLLEHAMTECGVVRLCVNEDNPRAAEFYKHYGFETIGRQEADSRGNEFPLLIMENRNNRKTEDIMEKKIAKDLLSIGAVFLRPEQPFTWASGIKSPIYCDNRLTLTAPRVRDAVEKGLAEYVKRYYPECEVLMGTSTAGIAHAAITATLLDLPMGYVRSGAKDHGRANQIEGRLEKGQKVVVVEDLISTAGSCIEVVNVLREAGAEVLGVVSIFTYGMKKGLDRLAEAEVENHSLSNLDALVETAAEEGYIKREDCARIIAFRNNPSDESWINK